MALSSHDLVKAIKAEARSVAPWVGCDALSPQAFICPAKSPVCCL
jgi:hypothetical protein